MTALAGYSRFLETKHPVVTFAGPDVTAGEIHPMLHDWQMELVRWACKVGRAAIWADTGLGKTVMQVEWARLVAAGGTALIVAPLAVCAQTVREAAKLGITATYTRDGQGLTSGIYVTNYEMVERFDPTAIDAVVLDEASILKQSTGKTRTMLIRHFAAVRYRLTCTATPAPNDPEELTNQAEFLGHSSRVNMLAAYFIHDDDGWRLKGHARTPMMRWMATWAVAIRKPSDLGDYTDAGYDLPGLSVIPSLLPVEIEADGQLFPTDLGGVGGRAKVRRETMAVRCERAAELVAAEPGESWLIWCGLNDEAALLAKLTGGVNVLGTWTPEEKSQAFLDFADGKITRLIVKPSASFGMNWQVCARMAFVGLSDSYESYYQAIRRCYRYGQTRVVHAHVILSELESQIAVNVARKEREAGAVTAALVAEMRRARREVAI